MDCSDEIVDLVAASSCFAPHFHLPLQHASDSDARGDAAAVHARVLTGGSSIASATDAARVDRLRCHRRISGGDRRRFRGAGGVSRESPLTHVHVFPYSDRPGTAATALPGKVHGAIVRERASVVRAIGRELTRKFHEAQNGTVRPGLTIEDGSLVVTDNYLKVRIPPGHARNEWVQRRGLTANGDRPERRCRLGPRTRESGTGPVLQQRRCLLCRRFRRAFHNQLAARRADVAAAALAHRHRQAARRQESARTR